MSMIMMVMTIRGLKTINILTTNLVVCDPNTILRRGGLTTWHGSWLSLMKHSMGSLFGPHSLTTFRYKILQYLRTYLESCSFSCRFSVLIFFFSFLTFSPYLLLSETLLLFFDYFVSSRVMFHVCLYQLIKEDL